MHELAHGFDPYADTAGLEDTGFLKSIAKGIGKAASSVAKRAVKVVKGGARVVGKVASNPAMIAIAGPAAMGTAQAATATRQVASGNLKSVKAMLPLVQQQLKSLGPPGMVGSGVISAVQKGIQGGSLVDIALAGAAGAAPAGIDQAIIAANQLRKGEPFLKVALDTAANQFTPGSNERFAFDTARKLLENGIKKPDLGAARRALVNEAQRRAFDVAVGTLARASSGKVKLPATAIATARRVGEAVNVLPPAARRRMPDIVHPSVKLAISAVKSSPNLSIAARQSRLPLSLLQRAAKGQTRRLQWRPLSVIATNFIRRNVAHAPVRALTSDTRGLDATGETYIVESGDSPGKIAKKLTGVESKWPELIKANPQKKTVNSKIGKVFATLYAKEKLIVPVSWRKSVAPTSPVSVPANVPPEMSIPEVENTSALLQCKSMLIAWTKTDGRLEAGVSDYGLRAEDLAPNWSSRDKLAASAFAMWSNRQRGTSIPTSGEVTPELLNALRAWTESRAAAQAPSLPTTPAVDPSASVPPTDTSPGGVVIPFPGTQVPITIPEEVLPPMIIAEPGTSDKPAQPPAAKKAEGSMLPMIIGGVAGGLIGGPVGAATGAVAGALVS